MVSLGCNAQSAPPGSSETHMQKPALHPTENILVKGHPFTVELARTREEQAQGLSHIASIDNTEGMLFLFTPAEKTNFWMKEMLFPIDILWIQGNKIIGIEKNVPTPTPNSTSTDLTVYPSPAAIDMVLEIRAGMADAYNIQVGDYVTTSQLYK